MSGDLSVFSAMNVDKAGLTTILQTQKDTRWDEVGFCAGFELPQGAVFSSFCLQGGDVPVPVSLEDLTRVKAASEPSLYCSSFKNQAGRVDPWEISASKLSPSCHLLNETVPAATKHALLRMGMSEVAILSVKAHPDKLMLYEPGGCTLPSKAPGVFATLLLHIPVGTGHLGGRVVVNHRSQQQAFDLNRASVAGHCVAAYSDCDQDLETISAGYLLLLSVHLTWADPKPSKMLTPRGPSPAALTDISATLSQAWGTPGVKLTELKPFAIPLEHLYGEDVSFSRLRGRDRMIAELLQSLDCTETHLTVLQKYQYGPAACEFDPATGKYDFEDDADDYSAGVSSSGAYVDDLMDELGCYDLNNNPSSAGAKRSQKNRKPAMRMVHAEKLEHIRWIASDDSIVSMDLILDLQSDLLDPGVDLFQGVPDRDRLDRYDASGTPALHHWFIRTLLVVRPKKTIDHWLAELAGFDGLLEALERMVKDSAGAGPAAPEETRELLGRTIEYCRRNRALVWKRDKMYNLCNDSQAGDKTRRLLRLCVDLNAVAEGLALMEALASDTAPEAACERISSQRVALALAEFVRVAGWSACAGLVVKMVTSPQAAREMEAYVMLIKALFDKVGRDAAAVVASQVSTLLFSLKVAPLSSLKVSSVCQYVETLFRLEECPSTSDRKRLDCFSFGSNLLDSETLCQLIVDLQKSNGTRIKQIALCMHFYCDMCRNFLRRGLDLTSKSNSAIVMEVLTCVLWTENEDLLRDLTNKMTKPTKGNNVALKTFLATEAIWKLFVTTEGGRKSLSLMVDARIEELGRHKPPVFTWAMPNAHMPDHPQVETFLRSSQETLTYSSFNGIADARKFADSRFTNCTNGYSATAVASGIGKRAYCVITKDKRWYNCMLHEYEMFQKELNGLNDKRRKRRLDGGAEQPPPEEVAPVKKKSAAGSAGGKRKKN